MPGLAVVRRGLIVPTIPAPPAGISFVRQNPYDGSTSDNEHFIPITSPADGNTLVLLLSSYVEPEADLTLGGRVTWTQAGSHLDRGTDGSYVSIYYGIGATGSASSFVDLHMTASDVIAANVVEFSGVSSDATVTFYWNDTNGSGGASTHPNPGALPAGDLALVTHADFHGDNPIGYPSGWEELDPANPGTIDVGVVQAGAYLIGNDAETPQFTLGSSMQWNCAAAVFS